MAELIGPGNWLFVGDVIMVNQNGLDRRTSKDFTWRWLGVVVKQPSRLTSSYAGYAVRLGALDDERARMLFYDADRMTIHRLPEAEWPDGVWAFRTQMILEGRLEIE